MKQTRQTSQTIRHGLLLLAFTITLGSMHAQKSPADFSAEPDKTLAAAHESFVKKDMNQAAEHLHRAAADVKAESEKVAAGSTKGMKKAGDELDKLGDGVKNGTVKSSAELEKTFAKVDHQIATCWHQTAAESKKSGKDASADLAKAGASLAGAAQWSGTQLKAGAQASVDGIKKAGQATGEGLKKAGQATGEGVKTAADQVDSWFKGIGEGISDLGHKL